MASKATILLIALAICFPCLNGQEESRITSPPEKSDQASSPAPRTTTSTAQLENANARSPFLNIIPYPSPVISPSNNPETQNLVRPLRPYFGPVPPSFPFHNLLLPDYSSRIPAPWFPFPPQMPAFPWMMPPESATNAPEKSRTETPDSSKTSANANASGKQNESAAQVAGSPSSKSEQTSPEEGVRKTEYKDTTLDAIHPVMPSTYPSWPSLPMVYAYIVNPSAMSYWDTEAGVDKNFPGLKHLLAFGRSIDRSKGQEPPIWGVKPAEPGMFNLGHLFPSYPKEPTQGKVEPAPAH